jgi:hypothetical protein
MCIMLVECRELLTSIAGKSTRGRDSVRDLDALVYFFFMLLVFSSAFRSSDCAA